MKRKLLPILTASLGFLIFSVNAHAQDRSNSSTEVTVSEFRLSDSINVVDFFGLLSDQKIELADVRIKHIGKDTVTIEMSLPEESVAEISVKLADLELKNAVFIRHEGPFKVEDSGEPPTYDSVPLKRQSEQNPMRDSSNWQERQLQGPDESPIKDKPKTAPVYKKR
jgi:hypothetical protein